MSKRICIAIVTYNRAETLKRALNAAFSQTYPAEQVIVVDNASTDHTAQVVEEFSKMHSGKLRYVSNTSNLGSAGGFSRAAEEGYKTGCDWIFLTDDDAIPSVSALASFMSSPHSDAHDTGILGCYVVDEMDEPFGANIQCKVNRSNFEFSPVSVEDLKKGISVESHTNSFDGMLVNRRAFEKVGYPDSKYFLWYDDVEFSLRVSSCFKIWVIPAAKTVHLGEARSLEKSHPWLKAKVETYDWKDCWRLYYRRRNFYDVLRKNSSGAHFNKKFFKTALKELLVPFLFNQDHKIERLKMAGKSAWDGYFSSLGKKVGLKPPFFNPQD